MHPLSYSEEHAILVREDVSYDSDSAACHRGNKAGRLVAVIRETYRMLSDEVNFGCSNHPSGL